ncbi:MAG: hypothetical protein Q9217_003358 [Psora testacea]
MAVEVALNTPLAEALSSVVQTRLSEVGWTTGGLDDSALGEYIILMLVNGKTQEQIAAELSTDLLSLPPDDPGAADFAKWLFDQTEILNNQLNGVPAPQALQSQPSQAMPSHEDQGTSIRGAATRQSAEVGGGDADMGEAMEVVQDGAMYVLLKAKERGRTLLTQHLRPTGPKSMRNSSRPGNKRMMGQLSKAMDRSGDTALHRVRAQQGTERINMHNRQPPKGPRNDQLRNARIQPNGRPIGGLNCGIANANTTTPMLQMTPQQQMQLMAMFEEQARMMAQIMPTQQQQMFMPGMNQPLISPAFQNGGQPPGRSLFDRVEGNPRRPNGFDNQRNGGGFHSSQKPHSATESDHKMGNGDISSSMEVESSHAAEPSPDPICKFNLKCTKKDCPYAHQSPAAPPGITIDVNDTCPFGAACKNKKCVARHPSPFQKVAHASEQDCKFFPHCTNASCPFRHPTMPMCKYGADCNRAECKFTHVNIMCKFNPCLNPDCPYKHAEGQKRGKFGDKVWTAQQEKEHVSERKFVDNEIGDEELVVPEVKTEDQACQRQHREHATSASKRSRPDIPDVAVLGGGITGLASAYYLSKSLPDTKIVLFEASSRLGGWLHSKSVDVGNGSVVFEQGPRTLRPTFPNGLITLDLVRDLGLKDCILTTDKKSPAAQNRFIYYPDHLVQLPGPGTNIFKGIVTVSREPLFAGAVSGVLSECRTPRRPDSLSDESIGSFLTRRFGSAIADNIASAVFHGIYAGDIYKLSTRTILPKLWYTEWRHHSIVRGMLDQSFGGLMPASHEDLDAARDFLSPTFDVEDDPMEKVKKASVFTFKGGLGKLSDRLEERLRKSDNVLIYKDTEVGDAKLQFHTEGSRIEITTRNTVTKQDKALWDFSHAISTLPSYILAGRLQDHALSSTLRQTISVTVMVVNLFFTDPSLLPVHGFGYLLPRSLPLEQNPEFALGVIFDSDATVGQDGAPGTKVTVMLGGHWWDDWNEYPDEEQGARMASDILKRHLNIVEEPKVVRVSLQKDCIPQYTVGHDDCMASIGQGLERVFRGKLRVAGSSYTGVGLNDCVRAARDVVRGLVEDRGKTGLDGFAHGKQWGWWPREMVTK